MKENKESKGTQFEEEKILLTEDQVKDQTEIKEETEKDDMVENGVHKRKAMCGRQILLSGKN